MFTENLVTTFRNNSVGVRIYILALTVSHGHHRCRVRAMNILRFFSVTIYNSYCACSISRFIEYAFGCEVESELTRIPFIWKGALSQGGRNPVERFRFFPIKLIFS